MKLLITRHAQTKNNQENIIHNENLPGEITPKGYLQIKKLIGRLKKEKISRVICSNLERCKLTAKEIIQEIPLEIEYNPLIREKENGDFGGMKQDEVNWDDLSGTFETRKAQNGENLLEVRERGRKFFNEVCEKYKNSDETILIISHGAFLKIFLGDLLGMPIYDSIFKLFIEHCSLTELEVGPEARKGFKLNFINEKEYLEKI